MLYLRLKGLNDLTYEYQQITISQMDNGCREFLTDYMNLRGLLTDFIVICIEHIEEDDLLYLQYLNWVLEDRWGDSWYFYHNTIPFRDYRDIFPEL